MMKKDLSTDYETYKEIMTDLLRPIEGKGLDIDTLRRLYESKLVYLENLRIKCFLEINGEKGGFFTVEDYQLILKAVGETNSHLRTIMLGAITHHLARKAAS
jgi:hypothetical protein